MKNFLIRALSGIIYVAVIVGMIMLGGMFGFSALCIIFAILGALEFYRMTDAGGGFDLIRCFDILFIIFIASLPIFTTVINPIGLAIVIAILIPLSRMVMQLYAHDSNPASRIALSMLSYAYIAFPMLCASAIYITFGWQLTLTMFAMIWLNDTGAYMVGCTLGRHKLFPRLSPKKSWEGFFGGLIFAMATGYVAAIIPGFLPERWCTPAVMLALGATTACIATWGDLMESMLKRAAHIKDSGTLIPGHGGILDRIDSLLFVAPATLVFSMIASML